MKNINVEDEVIVWNIYNTIREKGNTFRTLKANPDLRHVYHKNDDATVAHHTGLLACKHNPEHFKVQKNK